jgi:hypothetical protein
MNGLTFNKNMIDALDIVNILEALDTLDTLPIRRVSRGSRVSRYIYPYLIPLNDPLEIRKSL